MALPKLNNNPKYDLVIPSTKKTVKFRPYLVKEEKILLLAMETKDAGQALNAVLDTIIACVDEKIDPNTLTTFDIEYMFVKIRSKSVGETSEVGIKCSECEHTNKVAVDLQSIEINVPETNFMVPLTDDITIEMSYPHFRAMASNKKLINTSSATEQTFEMIMSVMKAIHTGEERIDLKDVSHKELEDFIESMTNEQLQKVRSFVETIPKMTHDVHFNCVQCSHGNTYTIEGMQNFF
jgi:T4 bacteriophage base plate protein